MTKEEANKLIASSMELVYTQLRYCEHLALEHKLSFDFDYSTIQRQTFEGAPFDGLSQEEIDEQTQWYEDDMSQPGWRNSSSYC